MNTNQSTPNPNGTPEPGRGNAVPPPLPANGPRLPRFQSAVGFKLVLITMLCLLFLIPLFLIQGLTAERQDRRAEAARGLADSWSGPLTVQSPVIIIPCEVYNPNPNGRPLKRPVVVRASELEIKAVQATQLRQRGIFNIPLYSLELTMAGSFRHPGLDELGSDIAAAHWERASFLLPLSSYRSLSENPRLSWNGQELALDSPGPELNARGAALVAPLGGRGWNDASRFELKLSLRGSDELAFRSQADATRVRLEADWTSPSFFGSALPQTREISERGLIATWQEMRYAQSSTSQAPLYNEQVDIEAINGEACESAFGYRLYQASTAYQMTDRSLKYGILFIIIPFTALFLIETIRRRRLHPIQYLLIGVANCLFFLLLLSLSEHLGFLVSYLAAAGLTTALVSWYASGFLRLRHGHWLMAGLLALLYGYMFTALQSEDWALLIGSLGLLGIVGTVMLATRRLDWYRIAREKP